jgi:hypothetical protein
MTGNLKKQVVGKCGESDMNEQRLTAAERYEAKDIANGDKTGFMFLAVSNKTNQGRNVM